MIREAGQNSLEVEIYDRVGRLAQKNAILENMAWENFNLWH